MKNNAIAIASFLFVSCIALSIPASAQKISEDHFENNEWNGSITYIYRTYSKHAGAYSEYVFQEHDNFHELRMGASITKGKGTATSTYTKREKSIRREKVAGKEYEYEDKHVGSANGSKTTELEILFNEEDNTYSINVPTPGYSGTATRTYTCSCGPEGSLPPKDYSMGGEESLIMVEDQKLGSNPNILAGEIVDRSETENGGVSEIITRWSFVRGPIDVELIVKLPNYPNWLPIPGKDEMTEGDKIQVLMQLQGKDGKEPRLKAKAFELRLVNTSHEPGLSINYPLVPVTPVKPDLQFLKQEGAELESEGQVLRVPAKDGKTGAGIIGSFDGGGYTVLEVEAILEGGLRVKGHLEMPKGPTEIEVPKRKHGTKIAQAWLDKYGAPEEMDDKETTTGTANDGDGLTVYEEYRGVFSEGKHVRLDPKKKEVGIRIKRADMAAFAEGINWFTAASSIEVVKLWEQELGEDRIFNKNSLSGKAGVQHGLKVLNDTLPSGVPGENQPIEKWPKTPRESLRTVVDIAQIKVFYVNQQAEFKKGGQDMLYTVEEEIASTIAHELMHGVNVKHHGKNSDAVDRVVVPYTKDKYLVYASNGSKIEFGAEPYKLPYKFEGGVGNEGCESSGDLLCIMAYTSRYNWCYRLSTDKQMMYLGVPPLPLGKHLCTSGAGTGINVNGFFGNATWGNCLSQLKVKDY